MKADNHHHRRLRRVIEQALLAFANRKRSRDNEKHRGGVIMCLCACVRVVSTGVCIFVYV